MAEAKAANSKASAGESIESVSDTSPMKNGAKAPPVKLRRPEFTKVRKLEPSLTGINLMVKVVSVDSRGDSKAKGTSPGQKVGEAVVGDETGTVILNLKKDQVEKCAEGKTIIIRNALVKMNRQHMRLDVNKWGKIELSQEEGNFIVDSKTDWSAVEYELVRIEE